VCVCRSRVVDYLQKFEFFLFNLGTFLLRHRSVCGCLQVSCVRKSNFSV